MRIIPEGLHEIELHAIAPWPGLNPRKVFADGPLQELATSIREKGLVQPVAAAPAGPAATNGTSLWLFAGERRLRAAALAGLERIPVIVRHLDEASAHRLAGIENLDRDSLTALEEARWIRRELELSGATQEELAAELGRTQGWVSNRLRLLELPEPVQQLIEDGTIAPATARDTLLRFTKLDEDLQASLFEALAKEIREEAVEGGPVSARTVREALVDALEGAGAVRAREGYQNIGSSYSKSASPSAKHVKAFVKAHPGRCVEAHGYHHGDREVIWTFAADEWNDVLEDLHAEQKSASTGSGKTKEQLQNVRLGPKAKPTTMSELKKKYGYEAVRSFDEVVDPSKLEPQQVVRVQLESYETKNGKPREALAVVAPPGSLRAMKAARTRMVTPQKATESQKLARSRLKKASRMGADEIYRGLLASVLAGDYFEQVCDLIRAEGVDVPESWSRYSISGKKVSALDLEGDALFRVAGAAAALAASDERSWDAERRLTDAAERAVRRATKKARDEWAAEHGFSEPAP